MRLCRIVVNMLKNPFTTHPHANDETYLQHLITAAGVARQLLLAGGAALTHAIFPFVFATAASNKIKALNDCLERNDRDGLRRKARVKE